MPESVDAWWDRRRWSKGESVPYPVGTFRSAWERYPVLVRQYHPDLNSGIVLTQIPPAADVYLQWQCDAGHVFVATPLEQRNRPGGSRRRSSWCPECLAGAIPARALPTGSRPRPRAGRAAARAGSTRPAGEAFVSAIAPKPASAAEARLRQLIGQRLTVDLSPNAVVVTRPFFGRLEVWPDIPIAELMVAIEFDTTGRDGLEHVGRREAIDRRKDRTLRSVGWEVVRIRCRPLPLLGPHDLSSSGVTGVLVDRLIDRLAELRGELIVRCYLAEG